MRHPLRLILVLLLFTTGASSWLTEFSWLACAQSTTTSAELKLGGAVSTPLTLTAADLKKMPRKTLSVVNPHNKKTEVYEGVLL